MNTKTSAFAVSMASAWLLITGGASAASLPVRTGLALHLDASAISGVAEGGRIDTWSDLSGSGNDMVRLTGDPSYGATSMNGRPGVVFDGDDYMYDTYNFRNPYTVFTVSRMSDPDAGHGRLISSQNENWLLGYHGGFWECFHPGGWVQPYISGYNTNIPTTPQLYVSNGDGTTSSFWNKGVLIASNNGGLSPPGQIALGGWNGGGETSIGVVSEVILYSRILDADEMNLVGAYLQYKWGIEGEYATFIAMNPATGSITHFSSGTADLNVFPELDSGYEYQFTLSEDASSISAAGWIAYDPSHPPATAVFPAPASSGQAEVVLWTRAGAAADPQVSGIQPIIFDAAAPTAVARDITVMLGANGTRTLLVDEVDFGSSDPSGIFSRSLAPATLTGPGTVVVTLSVTNNAGVGASALAQVTAIPYVEKDIGIAATEPKPVPQGYLLEMLHLGADFGNDYLNTYNTNIGGYDTDQLAAFGGEANLKPYDGLVFEEVPGATTLSGNLVWTALTWGDPAGQWSPNRDNYIKYWHIYLVNPDVDARTVRFWLAHDDNVRAWADGTLFYSQAYDGAEHTVDLALRPGVNSITFKLQEGGGGDYFRARITDTAGAYFDDLKYLLSPSIFQVAHPVTGSTEFTATNTLALSGLPYAPAGSEYQFTLSDNPSSLSPSGWTFLDRLNPPTEVTLPFTVAEQEYTVCIWTRAYVDGVLATNSATCKITYTQTPPQVRAHDLEISIDTTGGTAIAPELLDSGSSDAVSGIWRLTVDPSVVYAPGAVTFTAVNNAGLSASTNVQIIAGAWTDAHVSPEGSDTTGTGRPETPWRSITHAIDVLGDADITVYVHPGLYSAESGEIFPIQPRSITIAGLGGDPSAVVVSGAVDVASIFLYDGTETPFNTISFSGITTKGGAVGLQIAGSLATAISDCVFAEAATHGAQLSDCNAPSITDCVFRDNGENGLWLLNAPNTAILRDVFRDNGGCGLELGYNNAYNCDGTRFTDSAFIANRGNGIGNSAPNSTGLVIRHCSFIANGSYGFGEYHTGYWIRDLIVRSSLFAFNGNAGVYISHGSAYAYDCHFYRNVNGAFIDPNGGQPSLNANVSGNAFDVDPLLANWTARSDGAVYAGSPVIGTGEDQSNKGCYAGAGLAFPASADYYVRPDGDDANDGLADTSAGAFATLAPLSGLALNPGDTVHVAAGAYAAPVTLRLLGGTPASPVRIAAEPGAVFSGAFAVQRCENLVLDGLTFAAGPGLTFNESAACVATNCVFASGTGDGATIFFSPWTTLSGCVSTNNAGNGLWIYRSNGVTLDHDVFADNALCGFNAGNSPNNGDQYTCLALLVDHCFIARNGALGIGMSIGHIKQWVIDHCTILANGSYGISSYREGYWPEDLMLTNSIVANNGNVGFYMMHGQMRVSETLFWHNTNGDVGDCNGGPYAANADLGGCTYDQDPLLCPWASRDDGAVFTGSPALGAAADGSNLGCYQGPGVPPAAAQTYYVRPDGDDANDGLANTQANAFATVARGCRALANAGDTLCVAAGVYSDAAVLDGLVGSSLAPVSILAEEGAILEVSDPEATAALLVTGCGNIVVSGLGIRNGPGLVISGSEGVTLTNVAVTASTGHGAQATLCPNLTVVDSAFSGSAGHGLWIVQSGGATLLRSSFSGNALCGFNAGAGNGDQYTCLGLRASYCYFGGNGAAGLGMSVGHLSNWIADHCSFVANGSFGYGTYDTGYWPEGPVATNCLFAYNGYSGFISPHGQMYVDTSLFWGDGNLPITDYNGGTLAAVANRNANVFGVDPDLCDWLRRSDGALFAGSPAIGAAPDGKNYGCYQGPGEAFPAATTYYVRTDGNDANDGLANTPERAFATVSNACARALVAGDTIRVAAGEYYGTVILDSVIGASSRPIRIIAETGTVLHATQYYGLHVHNSAYVEVLGFTFVDGLDWGTGAGVWVESSQQCRFRSCVARGNFFGFYAGNGFSTFNTRHVAFEDCVAEDNTYYGFVASACADAVMDRCVASRNGLVGFYSNGYSYTGTYGEKGATLRHCIASDNGRTGVFSDNFGDQRLENCLVIRNGGASTEWHKGGVTFTDNTHQGFGNTVRNTIVAFNSGSGVRVTGNTYYEIDHICSYGNSDDNFANVTVDEGSISVDPMFRDYASGDYRLSTGSPCVDAGANQEWMAGAKDYGGANDRIAHDTVDIGLFELFQGGLILMLR